MEVVKAFEKASGRTVVYTIAPHRASELLDWKAQRTLEEICNDIWHFQSKNPNGYTK